MAEVAIPQKIGPYRIEREIGRGGMGVVYLAVDTKLDRPVAIKAMSAQFANDAVSLARFEREAKLLASLNHPRIGAIYALEEHQGARYLVLELVEGRVLKEIVADGPLPAEQAIDYCRQIADALHAAHTKGVMHRDLKPANVIVTSDGGVKVLDFGLAKSLVGHKTSGDSTASLVADRTIAGTVVGTPGYMSPEQVRGAPVDARTDVWSFGCILYECLTGRPAFSGRSVADLLAATLVSDPVWADLPQELPDVVPELIRRCLQKEVDLRLSDMNEVRVVLEELTAGARPMMSASIHAASAANNLPTQVTSFVGRQREMGELRSLLTGTRLLTLTGSGGCGKTRLAIELAKRLLRNYPDGVWFAELAPLMDPALAPKSVANALGIKEQPDQSLTETLVNYLQDKTTLLVLDNCEHLLAACAELVDRLLHGCAALQIVATGREVLGIAGETTYLVPSLSIPNGRKLTRAAELADYESVQLFVDRAKAAKPAFALSDDNAQPIVQICKRLDGIPLAIELAAARVRALSVKQIATRLDDSFRLLTGGSRTALPRHQTLRATIDWSYNLLTEPERTLLRRLSVFASGWALEAAERVCTEDALDETEALDLLTGLVDRSLAVYDESAPSDGRYRLLQTVRQYAAQELESSAESETFRSRHVDFYTAMAEEGEMKLRGPDQSAWLERLESEHENILLALDSCETVEGGALKALRLAGSLWRFWEMHGHIDTGAKVIETALNRPGAQEGTGARAAALSGAGFMALMRGKYPDARDLFQQGLTIRREIGDRTKIAGSLSNLGIVVHNEGKFDTARALHEESLTIRRELEDIVGITTSLICLGNVARSEGKLVEARLLYEQGLTVQELSKDKYLSAHLINNLGTVAHAQGRHEEACKLLAEGLSLRRELGDKRGIARSLEAAAGLATAMGEHNRSARLFGAAERLRQDIGCIIQATDRDHYNRDLAAAKAALDASSFDETWAEGRAMTFPEAVQYARSWLAGVCERHDVTR